MDDEKGSPDFLTKEFLEKTLQTYHNSEITIANYEIKTAVAKGDNYLSDIRRIYVEYKTSNSGNTLDNTHELLSKSSLMIKLPLVGGMHDLISKIGIIEKEVQTYYELSPKLRQYFLMDGNKDDVVMPNCFECDVKNVLVLEDLCFNGYEMLNRIDQLDYNHSILAIKNLAKFHAACVKLKHDDPELVDKIGKELLVPKNISSIQKKLLDHILGELYMEVVCSVTENWPECEVYMSFLRKLKSKIWMVLIDILEPKTGEFNVLNHGDLWLNNMLFKYDKNGKPQFVKFIDFQLIRYTSNVIDFLTFLYSSVRYNVLKNHYDEFITCYLVDLNLHLEKYGCEERLFETEMRESLEKRGLYCLIACTLYLPYVFADPNKDVDISELNPEVKNVIKDNPHKKYLLTKKFREIFPKHLEDFSKNSWFKNF